MLACFLTLNSTRLIQAPHVHVSRVTEMSSKETDLPPLIEYLPDDNLPVLLYLFAPIFMHDLILFYI